MGHKASQTRAAPRSVASPLLGAALPPLSPRTARTQPLAGRQKQNGCAPLFGRAPAATCLTVIREGMEEAIARGVPAEAARDFLFGHLRVELAILFGLLPFPLSDGALQAIDEARSVIFQPDWKQSVFDPAAIRASTERITDPVPARPA